ncbi:MAG: energy transducer TonB [Gammaproteobacteria bacterium]
MQIDPSDRLTYALGIAIVAHAAIILGVEFSFPESAPTRATPTLEVVLDPMALKTMAPEDAEFLGREDQRGSGNADENESPVLTEENTPPLPDEMETDAQAVQQSTAGSSNPDLVASRSEADAQVRIDLLPERPEIAPESRRLLTIAPLSPSQNPRERLLGVNTRKTLFADYLAAWTDKVERVGTLNFPDAARRLGMEGSPVLEVAIQSDGSLGDVVVRQSSGKPALDEAATRILTLAAPFDPFPRDLKDNYDVVRFAYEWRFVNPDSGNR